MFWTLALIGLALFLFNELHWKRRKYPPGPTPIPLVGNVISILWDFPGMSKYKEWRAKFGPIYTYWLGPWPIVTVNDYNLMQASYLPCDNPEEMFVGDGDSYADRSSFAAVADLYRGGSYGIADTNGQVWREQRRFALHTLRDFGLGKDEMQERILHEADDLLTQLEDDCKSGGSTKPMKYLEKTVASVINLTLFGFRFDKEHESEFYRLNKLLKDQVQVFANPLLLVFFSIPKLVPYIPIIRGQFEKVFKVRDALYGYFNEHVGRDFIRLLQNTKIVK
uniref:Cytochrome P450 n=1 Tax=Pristionchus pacificus TaxID=54126 RepID=A0A2A6CSG9_PRIPA|eukprot:PDM81135.1 cytochrome P450 [Pristionchus pacificus]